MNLRRAVNFWSRRDTSQSGGYKFPNLTEALIKGMFFAWPLNMVAFLVQTNTFILILSFIIWSGVPTTGACFFLLTC